MNPFLYKTEEEKKEIYKKSANSRKGKPSGLSGKRKLNNSNYTIRVEYNVKQQPCKSSIRFKCNETGEIFNSIRECCDILKIRHESVSEMLRGERDTQIGGYTFSKIEERVPYVVIVETGETFETVVDCAKKLETSKSSINRVLNGTYKKCKGYHICYYKDYLNK